jgi:hypothetical protein
MNKQMARLVTKGTFSNNVVNILGSSYPATLSYKVQRLVDDGEIDLSKESALVLVPNTLNPNDSNDYYEYEGEQPPYLDFIVIGVVVYQNPDDIEWDVVRISGKVIYENINHQFVLVKMQKGRHNQKIKLVGTLAGSEYEDRYGNIRGDAVDKFYDIEAVVQGKRLVIVNSWMQKRQPQVVEYAPRNSNVIEFKSPNTVKRYAA